MAQLQRGETFVDGQIVNAARLNNLVDLGIAQLGIIGDQLVGTISPDDQVLIWDAGVGLRRVTVATFISDAVGVTSVGMTVPSTFSLTGSPITTTGSFGVAWQAQSANTTLCGPPSGSTGTPAFRALNVDDITPATVSIAATTINWDLGNVFSKTLTANTGFGFANPNEGQIITVKLSNTGTFTVNWPGTIRWPGGVAHTMTALAGHHDICTFRYIDGLYWGTFDKDYKL